MLTLLLSQYYQGDYCAHQEVSRILYFRVGDAPLHRRVAPVPVARNNEAHGRFAGILFQAHSSAAKAGIDALSRVLAIECGPFGVRSNIIAPGASVSECEASHAHNKEQAQSEALRA